MMMSLRLYLDLGKRVYYHYYILDMTIEIGLMRVYLRNLVGEDGTRLKFYLSNIPIVRSVAYNGKIGYALSNKLSKYASIILLLGIEDKTDVGLTIWEIDGSPVRCGP